MNAENKILIVEDETNLRELMVDMLVGMDVTAAGTIQEARAYLLNNAPDLMLFDVKLPDGDGLELLAQLREAGETAPAIVITAFGTVERAAAAMRSGASDFIVKPFDNERFLSAIARALEAAGRLRLVEFSAGTVEVHSELSKKIVGAGGGLKDIVALLRRVASTDATVLINGESGTGKELIARAIHEHSPRLDGPFISINCSAIASTLIESELFGFERGAFTGAHAQRKGLIEAAQSGTLFLDEIGDMPMEAQSKLLRVLQEREIVRVGGRSPVKVDVRVIAATHRDLYSMVSKGEFRQDLLYRLNVVPIKLPPLRARQQDIPGLIEHFLQKHARQHKVEPPKITEAILKSLTKHDWPGNVRELQNLVERAVVLGFFELSGLAHELEAPKEEPAPVLRTLRQAVAEAERDAVVKALRYAKGNKAQAARLLGVSYKTLFNKIHDHNIQEAVSIE